MTEKPYDVFLSYNSKDRPVVVAVAHALREVGMEPWLDQWHLTPGGDWQVELAAGVRASRACAVFVGPNSVGAWSAMEVRLALDRAAKDPTFRCFPVLLPGVPEPFDPDLLPPFLSAFSWVSLRDGVAEPVGMQHLLNAIRGLPFGITAPPDGKPSASPIQAAATLPPTNLPAELTSFVGRENERADLVERFERGLAAGGCRLVTLVGTGGTGKTRLALAVAEALRPRFPGGVWLVGLAALSDGSLVAGETAIALGLREEPGLPILTTLTNYLKPRALLLVLDNCEHIIDSCARLAAACLAAAPALRLIATSREPLGVAGEQTYRVPSLPAPNPEAATSGAALSGNAAVQLFLERARASKHDFALTDQNARAVAAICARLDGLPLALELAAARLSAIPVEVIAARLSDRFKLLTGGPRTALPRQQTLRAALDWSYDLLTEPERVLLRRLSVFAGGCALEAAEAVCAGDDIESWDVLDLLAALVNKSLVQTAEAQEGARYRLLETVRQYSAERREQAGEGEALQIRLLAWSLALAGQAERALRGPEQARWLAQLETELDNLRAVLGWSMEDPERARDGLALAGLLSDYWSVRGHFSEGRRWLEQGLSGARSPDPAVLARAEVAAGKLAHNMGDYEPARAHYAAALETQKERGDQAGAADTMRRLGTVAKRLGRYDEAAALYGQSLELATALRDRWGMAAAHNNLGLVTNVRGDPEEAAHQYKAALAIFREAQDHGHVASVLNNLGCLAREQGDRASAAAQFTEALAIRRALDDKPGIAETSSNLGSVAFEESNLTGAQESYKESLALGRAIGDRAIVALACHNLARVLLAQGETVQAANCFRESLVLDELLGDVVSVVATLEEVAKALSSTGDQQGAATLLGAASVVRDEMSVPLSPVSRADHEQLLGAVRTALGNEQFAAAWDAGTKLNLSAAAALARERLDAG